MSEIAVIDCVDGVEDDDESWLIPTQAVEVDCRNIKWSKKMLRSFEEVKRGQIRPVDYKREFYSLCTASYTEEWITKILRKSVHCLFARRAFISIKNNNNTRRIVRRTLTLYKKRCIHLFFVEVLRTRSLTLCLVIDMNALRASSSVEDRIRYTPYGKRI